MVRSLIRGLSAVILIVGAAACGGGSGGGGGSPTASVTGNGLAPSTGPGDSSVYFPAAQGDKWSFNYVTNDPNALAPSAIVGIAVNGTKAVQGVTGTVFSRSDPTVQGGGLDKYYYVNGGGVTYLGSNSTDPITPLITPFVELLFPVQVGPVSTVTGTNLPFGKDSTGSQITLNLSQTITNAAIESIDVPAGSFTNAVRQETSINGTAYDSGQSSPKVSGTETTWMVPGVGTVKDQLSVTGPGTATTATGELRGYTVNGLQHGLGAAMDLVPIVSESCGGQGAIAQPSVASDGTNYLIVVHYCDSSGGAARYRWGGLLVGSDGTIKSSIDLSAAISPATLGLHSVVAFDGTNYLVVHEEDSTIPSTSPRLDTLLVSTAGTVVSGPNFVGTSYDDSNMAGAAQALAFDGGRYLLVYVDQDAVVRPPQLSGLFISPATGLADGTPFPVTQTNDYNHDEPAIAFDGTNYLVVWVENGSNPPGLSAVRISKSGTVLDAQPLLIMNDSDAYVPGTWCCDLEPSVSFDGSNYLVAYRNTRGAGAYSNTSTISATRVSPAGVLLDGSAAVAGIAVTEKMGVVTGRLRSVFMNGAHWLVWGTGLTEQLTASRVSPAGKVPSVWADGFSLLPPAVSNASEQWPAIAANANGALVTWLELQPGPSTVAKLRVMPVYLP